MKRLHELAVRYRVNVSPNGEQMIAMGAQIE
jgi:hypothetical protein